jgi:hypothetical protein
VHQPITELAAATATLKCQTDSYQSLLITAALNGELHSAFDKSESVVVLIGLKLPA